MVTRKKGAKEIFKIVGVIFAAVFLTLLFFVFLGEISFWFICGTWYGAWWLITRTNIEFEYILTSTVLDIDKIMAKRSRKRILSIDLKEISSFAPIGGNVLENIKIIDATPNGAENGVYAVDFDKDGTRMRLLFAPNKKMLTEIKKASPSLVTLSPEDAEGREV
jgi:hypothetical protein